MFRQTTPKTSLFGPGSWRVGAGLVAGAVLTGVMSTPASTQAPVPQGRSFTSLAPGYTQELFATTDVGTFPFPNDGIAKVLGGIAFAPDGDVWAADCVFQGSTLHRFDATTFAAPQFGTSSRRAEIATVVLEGAQGQGPGCGLTNHPDGALYSNSIGGIYKLKADYHAGDAGSMILAGPLGRPGNALGIAVDPQTFHLVYPGADCHDTLLTNPAACTLWDLDPVSGSTVPFARLPHPDVPFVDGVYFTPDGNYLFVTNRIDQDLETTDGPVHINQLTIVRRPTGPVSEQPSTDQVVRNLPMLVEPDGVAFHSVDHFVVTNDEANGSMTRFDFPGGDYSLEPTTFQEIQPIDDAGDPVGAPLRVYGTPFAAGGHRGDLTQVGPDGCLYATQGRNFVSTEFGTRYDDGTETHEDSVVRICSASGGGFEPPPGVRSESLTGSIAGSVYFDANGNHAIDPADTFLADVPVTLNPSATSVSSTSGPAPAYLFDHLSAGSYTVSVPATFGAFALSASTPSGTAATITAAGEHITDIDFLYEPGRLSGTVYLDVNDSGTIDAADTRLANVPITLSGAASASSMSADAAPGYAFPGLPGGDYQVSVPETAAGYLRHTASPLSRTVNPGGAVTEVDFLYTRARLSGFAYVDSNGNNAKDPGEPGIPGVSISMTGFPAATTAADGSYAFTGLAANRYSVDAPAVAAGYGLSTLSPLAADVPAGGSVADVNFGYRPGALSGFAYIDTNLNLQKDPGEPGLGSVGIALSDGGSATTAPDGAYAFGGLAAGHYVLAAPPTAFGYTRVTAGTLEVDLAAGRAIPNLNFGYAPPPPTGSIAGVAYVDSDNDGSFDVGEPVIGNVTVTLSGAASATQPTTTSGYQFGSLVAGNYTVSAPAAATYNGSTYNRSTSGAIQVTLAAGENRTNVNFGYRPAIAFATYTQGGWGATPAGNNPGMLLQNNFNAVFATCPSKSAAPTTTANNCVTIGIVGESGRYFLRFTSSTAIKNFLPAGGSPKSLKASVNNPTSSGAGVFAGQVLAVQLAVAFSNTGITAPGLKDLRVASGFPLAGRTVTEVLAIANRVLGGDLSVLPAGVSISTLNDVMTRINENFDNGTTNNGFLVP